MNQPEPNDAQDMSSIDLEADPNFLVVPSEMRTAGIDAQKNHRRYSPANDMFTHDFFQKWREEKLLNELCKTKAREMEESNRRVLEDIALGELIQSEFENLVNSYQSHFEDENTSIKITLKLDKTHDTNNKPLGTQFFHVPHIDETKLDALKSFYLIYGDIQCIYRFDSGKEIRVYVKDKREGFRVINKLLKVVRSENLQGNAQKHCEFKEVKRNKKPGTKGTLKCLHIVDSTDKKELYEFKNRDKLPNH
jgi:hypothetical protein